ncbi:hypothetical protein CBER1_09442 [Cercospora berteroae]|uniref:Uncharacterized protein n=1 Tax=Cercospora berteroae TaxID=357750 RepID=A0A2S6CNQ7_9PEZI|nr:hypothetical protein CBER1_09442 [Cercospora berteroae]
MLKLSKQVSRRTGVWNDAQLDPDQLRGEFPAILQQSPSASMNSLLREYYSRVGEVGLRGEELAGLDFEYQQYKATRVEVEKRRGDAIAAAEESTAQCILAGLDPEALLPDTSLDGFMLPEPLFMARTQERQDTSAHILAGTAHVPQPDAADSKQAMVVEWATKVTAVDEEPAVPGITTEEILAMNQRQWDKWGHQIIQRPRGHSSESHLRWKGNESHKELMYSGQSSWLRILLLRVVISIT